VRTERARDEKGENGEGERRRETERVKDGEMLKAPKAE